MCKIWARLVELMKSYDRWHFWYTLRETPCRALYTRGVETCAHGAQGVRGLKRDFRAKTPFYWVKMDFEEKIDAVGEKLGENSQINTI